MSGASYVLFRTELFLKFQYPQKKNLLFYEVIVCLSRTFLSKVTRLRLLTLNLMKSLEL